MLFISTAYRPAEFMSVDAVMLDVLPSGEDVVIDQPDGMGEMDVTLEWNAHKPPESVKLPSRNCIRLWESTMPVLGLSSTPA